MRESKHISGRYVPLHPGSVAARIAQLNHVATSAARTDGAHPIPGTFTATADGEHTKSPVAGDDTTLGGVHISNAIINRFKRG